MNFKALKWMIDSLVQVYKCPSCESIVWDNNVDIIWAAWTNINIDVECPTCNKHSMIKAEIVSFDLWKINISQENLNNLKDNLVKLKDKKSENNILTDNLIKDEEIVNLNKELKDTINVSDLFDIK